MDEYTTDAFANRDSPVPFLSVTLSDVDASSSDAEPGKDRESKRHRLRRSLSPSRLKERIYDLSVAHAEKVDSLKSEGSLSLQDRLFAKILQQVVPPDDFESDGEARVDRRSSKYLKRPAFSLPLMTNNFRRFNARIGIVFVFQNRLIRLFTWRTTSHTLSFLCVYTFVCLDPYLLVVLPLATALLFIMVPAFLVRHPPPPSTSTSSTTPYANYSYSGPALAPPSTIRPASETSKDFFRNMRDLQNSMADFATIHDALVRIIAPATNFSDEVWSSSLFLLLTILTTLAFIAAALLPWRLIFLTAGYAFTLAGHPAVQAWLMKQQKRAEGKAATVTLTVPTIPSSKLQPQQQLQLPQPPSVKVSIPTSRKELKSAINSLADITLDMAPEMREVEVFELQHRPLLPGHSDSADSNASVPGSTTPVAEWTHHMFTPSPYDPLSPSRISGDRPKGCRFFEDVQSPPGWVWAGPKWELDLEPGEWVSERLVTGVEYDVYGPGGSETSTSINTSAINTRPMNEKGDKSKDQKSESYSSYHGRANSAAQAAGNFGGWVWDLPPPRTLTRDEDLWLAYGDYDFGEDDRKDKGHKKRQSSSGSAAAHKAQHHRDWEEAVRYGDRQRTGEWRRRRWVRMVRRVPVASSARD